MNIDTGEIRRREVSPEELAKDIFGSVEVKESDMTEKQKKLMRVDLKDNRSRLGKIRVQEKTKRRSNRRKQR